MEFTRHFYAAGLAVATVILASGCEEPADGTYTGEITSGLVGWTDIELEIDGDEGEFFIPEDATHIEDIEVEYVETDEGAYVDLLHEGAEFGKPVRYEVVADGRALDCAVNCHQRMPVTGTSWPSGLERQE